MKHPDTARLAQDTFDATGAKTHPEFCDLTDGAIALRTFRRWLAGDGPADEMAKQYLELIKTGWRPNASARATS